MATDTQRLQRAEIDRAIRGERSSLPLLALLAGWLVPGAGHLVVGKPIRAALLFVSILGMFLVGLKLDGKVAQFNSSAILDLLVATGQLGLGLLYALARLMGWGAPTVLTVLQDYGTKFLIAGGLLNFIACVDAHSLASGRKAS